MEIKLYFVSALAKKFLNKTHFIHMKFFPAAAFVNIRHEEFYFENGG